MPDHTSLGDIADSMGNNPEDSNANLNHGSLTLHAFFQRKPSPISPKKIKITAENGKSALRQLQAKRTKREAIAEGNLELGPRPSRFKLKFMLSMPLDILFEIFCHLLPVDILQLSRTSKELRALLLHRSSSYVWKAALVKISGLPACPDDMSLPFWTNLVFDHHCHGCLVANVQRFNFLLRVRYCAKCAKHSLLSEWDINTRLEDGKLALNCIPFSVWQSNHKRCTVADRDRFLADLASAKTNGTSMVFVEQKKEALTRRTLHARSCEAWLKEVKDIRELELNSIRNQRATQIRKRLADLDYNPELKFLDDIDAGLCSTLPRPNICSLIDHPCVNSPEPLTERNWISIKPKMVRYMGKVGDLIIEEVRSRTTNNRRGLVLDAYNVWRIQPRHLKRFPLSAPMPRGVDILTIPEVEALLNLHPTYGLGLKEDVLPCFDRVLEDGVNCWRKRAMRRLLQTALNRGACGDIADIPITSQFHWSLHDNWLRRAVVVFRCKQKAVPNSMGGCPSMTEARAPLLWYPHFLRHGCTSIRERWRDEQRCINDALSTASQYPGTCQTPWNTDVLELDEKASRATCNILEACGMDWEAATTEELDARDPRVVCLKCTYGARCDGERSFRVWTWRDAVHHCLTVHFGDSQVKWECISPADAIDARRLDALECAKRAPQSSSQQKIWRCMKCRDTAADTGRMTWTALQVHFLMISNHCVAAGQDDKEGVVYHKDLDCFPCEGPVVKMIPKATVPTVPVSQ